MTRPLFALSLGFGGLILATEIAFSQPQCDARDRVTGQLADRWGETRRALGLAGDRAMMELFANDTTGTWTVTLTLPDGRMCLMASGDSYEAVTDDLPARGPRI
jgi:hypothetical protein